MAEAMTKLAVKTEDKPGATPHRVQPWRPFGTLRREMDRLFDDFDRTLWSAPFPRRVFDIEPFWERDWTLKAAPAVDVAEKDNAYEITAELPGLEEKNIEVKLTNGTLSITGEKREEKEEKTKDYHVKERSYGSFHRSFSVPDSVDAGKIEAKFKNGVLTVTLPKKVEAVVPAKKIEVKAA